MSTIVDDLLEHAGVKGMRWGVRKAQSVVSAPSHPASEDHFRAAAAKTMPAHSLSNNDMQALITRMNLEKQYVSAMAASVTPSKASKVTKFVSSLLLDVGKEQATRVARAKGMKVTDVYAKDKLDLDVRGLLKKNK